MDKEQSHMTERILNLTLEIIYLLTGEDYLVVKKTSGKHITPSRHPTLSRHWNGRQRFIMEPPPFTLINSKKKILEVTNKMIELLMGEVPIRCQDVAVYFSMEEWEYIEEHKDLYEDIMMEDGQHLTPDGSKEKERGHPRPLYFVDSAHEDCKTSHNGVDLSHNITYHYQGDNLIVIKVEDDKETRVRSDELCEEEMEEILPEISIDERYRQSKQHVITVDEDDDVICDSPIQNDHISNLLPAPSREDLSSDTSPNDVCIIEDLDTQDHSTSPRVENLYPCPQYAKCVTQSSNLGLHQRIHLRSKPYGCSTCGKSFTQKFHLFTHQRIHTGEKPFSCSLCGKCFHDKANLFRHGKIHKEDKPYLCHVCGRCFKDKSNLSKHHRTHTGEKPYSCFECGKCFSRNSHLNKHHKSHLRAKTYSGSTLGTS